MLSLAGLAASANWLAGSSARRLRRLKTQSEVYALLPPSRGKLLLEQILDDSARRYALSVHMAWPLRWLVLMVATGLVAVSGAVALILAASVRLFDESPPAWTGWAVGISVPATVAGLAAFSFVIARAEKSLDPMKARIDGWNAMPGGLRSTESEHTEPGSDSV